MSILFRALLIVIVFIINAICFFSNRHAPTAKRCYNYLFLQILFFPIIGLATNAAGSSLSLNTFAFLIINSDIFLRKIKWSSHKLVIGLFLIMITSALFSFNVSNALLTIPTYSVCLVVYLTANIVFSDKQYANLETIVRFLKILIFYVLSFALIQIFINRDFNLYYNVLFTHERISSCMPDPQLAGVVFAILFMYLWNLYAATKKNNFIYLAGCTSLFISGAFTGSKSFFLGLCVAMLVYLWYGKKNVKITICFCLILFACIIYADQLYELPVFQRFKDADESLDFRKTVFWAEAINIFNDNWLLGIGPGNFQSYAEYHHLPLTHGSGHDFIYATQPESGWLLLLDEYGIFSIFWLIFFTRPFMKKQSKAINVSLLTPWIIAYVSVNNLSSMQVTLLLFMTIALIEKSKNILFRKEQITIDQYNNQHSKKTIL